MYTFKLAVTLKMRHYLFFIFTFLFLDKCLYAQTPSNKAKKYLDKVISLIETNYYFIDSIDFVSIKNKAYSSISNAKKSADTYSSIDTILKNLYERHSFFLRPEIIKKYR